MLPAGLRAFADDPAHSALLLDFDGTVAPIAPTPASARPATGAIKALATLVGRFRLVAIVTGRRAADAAGLLQGRVRVLGLYGAEDTTSDRSLPSVPAPVLRDVQEAAAGVTGAWVEEKGSHLAVHYRATAQPDRAGRALEEALVPLARRHGLAVFHGKRVLELAPLGSPTKGDAVRNLVEEQGGVLARLLFVGDTEADMDAFAALDAIEGVEGVKVAVRAPETPPQVLDAADLIVEGAEGVVALLTELVAATSRR